ncbi:ROK family protein [Candidatus Parcubacteria bacterium]|nr:MAG: ROK family protein [Candidatus Parcubacteria bacterium]
MSKNYYIGVDIGGTKINAGLVFGNSVQKRIKILTESHKGKQRVLKNLARAVMEVWQDNVKGIGIGCAGEIDRKAGKVITSPNFHRQFENVNIKKFLERKFKRPVSVENDANCFTLAESKLGSGRGAKYVVGLTLGTGIGSGMVFEGKIFHGQSGAAGEWGHTAIVDNGLNCSCGKTGHLETYSSGKAMIKLYKTITGEEKDTFYIEKMAIKKQKAALQVFKIMSDALAVGLANIINALNPTVIVIGGGLARVELLWQPATKKARRLTVFPDLAKTRIVRSALGDDAQIIGATLLIKK